MLTLEPPDRPRHRYSLIEDSRNTRKAGDQPAHVRGWIELSEAAIIPLDADLAKTSAELASFYKAEAETHHYHYVSFTCSFGPAEGEPFERAWLEVYLSASGGGTEPVAWSLSPKDAWDDIELSSKANIGAEFELISAGVDVETKQGGKSYFLRAYRERLKNPYWEFRSTDTTRIDGTYRFHMITRALAGTVGIGVLKLSATIMKRKFLILTSEEQANAPPEVTFDLLP